MITHMTNDNKNVWTLKKNSTKNTLVHCVIFGFEQQTVKVLLIKDEKRLGQSSWCLPYESTIKGENYERALESLLDKFNIKEKIFVNRFQDPGIKKIGDDFVNYYVLINMENYRVNYTSMNCSIRWAKIDDIPNLSQEQSAVVDGSIIQLKKLASLFSFLDNPELFND